MKRIISIFLAVLMLLGTAVMLFACDKEQGDGSDTSVTEEKENKVNASVTEIYEVLDAEFDFTSKVSDVITMADDDDEMIMMQYGVVDMEAYDHLEDYLFTMPSDYCNTFALFTFDTKLSDEAVAELKAAVLENYTKTRASALQMYMPEEYEKMVWATENEDATWREYDNALVLIITGDKEATDAFEAFEKAAIK